MSNNKRIRNLAHFTALIGELSEEKEGTLFRIFKVFHPVLEAETDIKVRQVSSSYHILEKYMDLLVCGSKENRNPNVARIKDKDQLLSLLGINYEGYEIASLYFDDLVNEGHFKVTENGIYPLKCAELSIDSVSLEDLYKSLKEDPEQPQEGEEQENVKLEYKYTEKLLFEKKLFDQFSLELMPREFYGLDGFLAVGPTGKAQKDGSENGVWLTPGVKLLEGATAIQRSLDNLYSAEFSFIERGIPEGTERITLAPDCLPELIYCPYYLAIYKNGADLTFSVHEVLYGKEIKWMSDKYNNANKEKNEYFDARNLICALCEKEEKATVYSPVFADWPLKIGGRTAYEYGYIEGENGNFIWQMQPWQLDNILRKCQNAEQRKWVEFALAQKVAVLDSYEAGRLVETHFPEDLRKIIEEQLQKEPLTAEPDQEETQLAEVRKLFIEKPEKAESALKKLAETSGEANFLLGSFYLQQDLSLSAQYFKKSREMGYAPAGYFLCIALLKQGGDLEKIKNILAEDQDKNFAPTLYALSVIFGDADKEKAENLRARAEDLGYKNGDTADILRPLLTASPQITYTAPKESQQAEFNPASFFDAENKGLSFGENIGLSAADIIKAAAENYPKKEFTDEEYKTIDSRLWGEYMEEELEELCNRPKSSLYSTTAFVGDNCALGFTSRSGRKPTCFKHHSVAVSYDNFVKYSKVTSKEFLHAMPNMDIKNFIATVPDPFAEIIPSYKDSPKINDRHDLSYRYAPLSKWLETSEFEEVRKTILHSLNDKNRYHIMSAIKDRLFFETPTKNRALMLFLINHFVITISSKDKEAKIGLAETLSSEGEISQLLKKADLLLSKGDTNSIKEAKSILNPLVSFSGHAAFLWALTERNHRNFQEYNRLLSSSRAFCSPYAFDITDNAFPYGDFKEFSAAFHFAKTVGKYTQEQSEVFNLRRDIAPLFDDDDEVRDNKTILADNFLTRRENFLSHITASLKKELAKTPFPPAITHSNNKELYPTAAALGGVVAAEKLADIFLREKNYTAAENCLLFAASRGNLSAAKSLVNFYLSAENWNPQKACFVLDRICDIDSAAMSMYVMLFKLGLDTEIAEYKEIVQSINRIINKF